MRPWPQGSSKDPTLVDLRERVPLRSLGWVLPAAGEDGVQAGAVDPEARWNQATESEAPLTIACPYHGVEQSHSSIQVPRTLAITSRSLCRDASAASWDDCSEL
jgi:hypothetical protein